jgi:uncharacterized protein with HEPN domain
MPRSDIAYLRHILDAINRIEEYLQGVTEADFYNRYLIQDGVIRQIEIIGEATKQLSKETRENNSQIPWRDIAGMRDKLTHHYFGVDMEEVWLTAQEDLPTLKREVEMILKAYKE